MRPMLARYSRRLESASMALMMFGIGALCQPWVEVLHRYSILLVIVGLVAFNVFSRIPPAPQAGPAEGS